MIEAGEAQMAVIRDDALANRDWGAYLGTFGSAERLPHFLAIQPRMTDAEYWEHLADTWISNEFALSNFATWKRLLFATRPAAGAVTMMNAKERATFDALPDAIAVYRGQQDAKHRLGFSWTLSREKAAWFAQRRGVGRMNLVTGGVWKKGRGVVFKGAVAKADVLCYLNEREEEEVIVHPDKVQNIRRTKIR